MIWNDRPRMLWIIGVIIAYAAAYFLWSNIVIFTHDIGAWVAKHFTLLSAVISTAAAYFDKRRLACLTFFGYNFGILSGGLWGRTSFDPGGGLLHNGWMIWICVFIGCIAAGFIMEILNNTGKIRKQAE